MGLETHQQGIIPLVAFDLQSEAITIKPIFTGVSGFNGSLSNPVYGLEPCFHLPRDGWHDGCS